MDNRHQTRNFMEYLAIKLHRTRANHYFTEECVRLKILPSSTFIPKRVLEFVHWGKDRLKREREKILLKGLRNNQEKMEFTRLKFNDNLKKFFAINNITSEKERSKFVLELEEIARKKEEKRIK